MREFNEALVTALRALPTNATTLQLYKGAFAVFAQLPVPDPVAVFKGTPGMFLSIGPPAGDENPPDKDGNLREIATIVTVSAAKDWHSASEVDLKAQEIIDELRRQPSKLTVAGHTLTLLEVQGILDNDVDYWFGRVVGVRALLE